MKCTLLVLTLSNVTAWAAASPAYGLAARVGARTERNRLSHIRLPASSPKDIPGLESTNQTNIDFSCNWAGAVLAAPPSGTIFTSVSAEFTVPIPRTVNNRAGSSSAWVGIDGDTYQNAILQTGIDFSVTADGSASFTAWYEWYPDYAYDFSGISIQAGDTIFVLVRSSSFSTGIAIIENLTTGEKVAQTLTAPHASSTLGGQNAEWIVEDYKEGDGLVTLDNFGLVAFSNARAGLSDGSPVGTDRANIVELKQNGRVLTSVSVPSASEVIITSRSWPEGL
ncbi:putative aspergillopepsin-2 precursor [Talaromyces proteolyticus]|uniref:Aspergillopepsin-2 n=1 Tax=Talaromyces proteolyticus TaxID=1131652 RepID=A0AAD4KL68_9EURO|nr:putative aspergillopepsin-2 precursor [Talaromyces proteolyticus]KAH8691806.1 putative aspergillopepsin-2 precursor [Talaromyces proteolyticus]